MTQTRIPGAKTLSDVLTRLLLGGPARWKHVQNVQNIQILEMFKTFKCSKCSNFQTIWQVNIWSIRFYRLLVQAWGSTSPHKHSMTSLKEHGNNCRNPDNYSSPWYVPFHSLLWLENWFLLVFWTAKNKRKAASAPSISKSQIFLSPKHSFWLAIYNLEKVLIILLCYIFMFSWIPLPSWATTRWSWYFMSQRLKILW